MLGRSFDIGWAHVHSHGLDLRRIPSMLAQRLSKGAERFGTTPFDHEQQPPVAIQHVSYVTVPPAGAGLVNSDAAHLAPVAPCLGLLDVMDQYSPQTRIRLA